MFIEINYLTGLVKDKEGYVFNKDTEQILLNVDRIDYIEEFKEDYIVLDEFTNKVYKLQFTINGEVRYMYISEEDYINLNAIIYN